MVIIDVHIGDVVSRVKYKITNPPYISTILQLIFQQWFNNGKHDRMDPFSISRYKNKWPPHEGEDEMCQRIVIFFYDHCSLRRVIFSSLRALLKLY
jgi:hypothetical protein